MTDASSAPGYNLVHPVYLDVPMMISFLARLEGGVVVDEEQTSTQTGARERLLKGRSGLRGRFGPLVSAEAEGEASNSKRTEESIESRASRHHTAASLFNLLYDYLVDDHQFTVVENAADLEGISPGQLVELTGEYLGNPLEEILTLLAAVYPYILAAKEAAAEDAAPSQPKRNAQPARHKSGNQRRPQQPQAPAPDPEEFVAAIMEEAAKQVVTQAAAQAEAEAELGMQMMLQMAKDIADVPVHDVLVRTAAGIQAVLTVDSAYYSAATNEYLRAGDFRVIGKVTRVLRGEQLINLTRRTVMGATNAESAQEMIGSLDATKISIDVPDPIVRAPAVQILPMAIFL